MNSSLPSDEDIAPQSEDNKQGRMEEGFPQEVNDKIKALLKEGQETAYRQYEELLETGVAREIARINLPLSMYTEWYWTNDLHNLFHFLRLRMDPHAQKEIRLYAEAMFAITKKVAPLACESFENHLLGGVRFSKTELGALQNLLAGKPSGLEGKAQERFEAKIQEGRQK
jgi:thymidylate synthase (FAD)